MQRAHDPPSLHGRVGAWKRRLPARSSPAGSSVSLFFLGFFFFFLPPRLHLFLLGSAILAKPQPLAILRAHPAPSEPHRCRDPPRGHSAAPDRAAHTRLFWS